MYIYIYIDLSLTCSQRHGSNGVNHPNGVNPEPANIMTHKSWVPLCVIHRGTGSAIVLPMFVVFPNARFECLMIDNDPSSMADILW